MSNPCCCVYIRNSLHSGDEDGGWCIFSTMSSVFLRDVGGLAPFDCSDTAGISARWERWLRAFELFADGKGVKHADQKKALMLHTAGLSVQDIFFTLDEGTGENNYLKAKDALDKYFKPQANVPYERLCFREMRQLPTECGTVCDAIEAESPIL